MRLDIIMIQQMLDYDQFLLLVHDITWDYVNTCVSAFKKGANQYDFLANLLCTLPFAPIGHG